MRSLSRTLIMRKHLAFGRDRCVRPRFYARQIALKSAPAECILAKSTPKKAHPPKTWSSRGALQCRGRAAVRGLCRLADSLELPYFSALFTAMKALVLAKLQEPPTCMSRATAAPVA